MPIFSDILYGTINLPDWLEPFIRLPEFVRLRGVRLSNVDSYQFKDFSGPTRWEHGIAVAYLAQRCASHRGVSEEEKIKLILAGLLHDVATPPFAHTAEYVLENFDHEFETQMILSSTPTRDTVPDVPIFCSQLPQFQVRCEQLASKINVKIHTDEIARMITGDGANGFLICGTLDLDNADNVTRACRYMGIDVDPSVPIKIAEWLAEQEDIPSDLANVRHSAVQEWLQYRGALYGAFFESSEQELGRQAFLQHLMRRALKAGLPRRALIWNTDEGLLAKLEDLDEHKGTGSSSSLRELVQRYRLLEETHLLFNIPLDSEDHLRVWRLPQAANWLEEHLSTPSLELFLSIVARRHGMTVQTSLFPPAVGAIYGFKLGSGILKSRQLPDFIQAEVRGHLRGSQLTSSITDVLRRKIAVWVQEKPWLNLDSARKENIRANLASNGDWSFRLSRNESLHPYPGTYVHALPATLISSLGLRGELILDPFGGTGQTAAEAIRLGGSALSSDTNSIATLVARAKLTYLPVDARARLKAIISDEIFSVAPSCAPEFENREKWHHPRSLDELCRIQAFIQSCRSTVVRQFLMACFSATIPDATGRRGKQHGYFADNTPLPAGQDTPPYQPAIELFINRVKRNVSILERYYASIQRDDRDPARELKRARILQLDATEAAPSDYGVQKNTIAGIITSPPYLCMADYTLGQRLSYYWLHPEQLKDDFGRELAARRQRSDARNAPQKYFDGLSQFVVRATQLLRPGGFLAMVVGAPKARKFSSIEVLKKLDNIVTSSGFEPFWTNWRPVQWHRNHGYQRLRREQIAIYTLGKADEQSVSTLERFAHQSRATL